MENEENLEKEDGGGELSAAAAREVGGTKWIVTLKRRWERYSSKFSLISKLESKNWRTPKKNKILLERTEPNGHFVWLEWTIVKRWS